MDDNSVKLLTAAIDRIVLLSDVILRVDGKLDNVQRDVIDVKRNVVDMKRDVGHLARDVVSILRRGEDTESPTA